MKYVALMRMYQWNKNLFIFAPAFFGFSEFAMADSADLLLCFVAFCLLASGIYVINDIVDVNADRAHPKKSLRPIAAGKISIKNAFVFAFALIVFAFLIISFVAFNKYQLVGGGMGIIKPNFIK